MNNSYYIPKYKNKSIEERFYMKFDFPDDKNECWIWKGAKNTDGYGSVNINNITYKAHRLSYQIFHGNLTGLEIMHTCDNPACVNPSHLIGGTHADNMLDMKLKGRGRSLRGEKNKNSKLTNKEILKIRKLYKTGKYLQVELARKFNIDHRTISLVINRKSWTHI